jgi:hypothetical protein
MVVYLPLFYSSSASISSLVAGDHLLRDSHSIGPVDSSTGLKVAHYRGTRVDAAKKG